MAFQYLTNTPLAQAQQEYLAKLISQGMEPPVEQVPIAAACGRITAEAIYAHICAPHYHASAMDGIALDARLTFGATETTPVQLTPGQFVVVDTGDPIPEGCDAVVMIEDVIENEDGSVRLYSSAAPWQHIRQIGEDICAGDEIIAPTADPQEGDILEFNSSIFSGMLRDWGAEVKTYPIVKDQFELIKQAVQSALAECDMVILNAGSSAGRED